MDLKNAIETRLQSAFEPSHLEIIDESDQHHGHAAHSAGARHFAVIIASSKFQGLSRINAHQKIYAELTDLMPHPLHALKITIKNWQ